MKEHKYNNIDINQSLIGKKVRGFKFDDKGNDCGYNSRMDDYIGQVGEIYSVGINYCAVEFANDCWNYPSSLIHKHLVEEETTSPQKLFNYLSEELGVIVLVSQIHDIERIVLGNQPSPQIIDLSNVEGVDMMVSCGSLNWSTRTVVAKVTRRYIDSDGESWNFAKPIEVKKVTMQEVEEKFGCKVEIVKED